jgi:type IV fimbrial biogenesis protein FimT
MTRFRFTSFPARRVRARGFTLLELLITIALLSIALAIAIPSINTGSALANAEAKAFKAALNMARSEAVSRSRTVVLCASDKPTEAAGSCAGGWTDGWIIYIDENANGGPDSGEIISRQDALGTGITVTASGGDTVVSFAPTGFTTNDGDFTFCTASDKSAGRRIVLAASGRAMKIAGAVSC